jgi:hypothetical protein
MALFMGQSRWHKLSDCDDDDEDNDGKTAQKG